MHTSLDFSPHSSSAHAARNRMRHVDTEIASVIASLENVLSALRACSYTEEAGIVWGHVQKLRSSEFRNKTLDKIGPRKQGSDKVIDNVMRELASSFKPDT